jgi:putative solute:sodium symporter small subunit
MKKVDYWKKNLAILGLLLPAWALISFGISIVWVDWFDQFSIGPFKLGFWVAQQGSIYSYLVIIFVYVLAMNRLDQRYHDSQKNTPQEKR